MEKYYDLAYQVAMTTTVFWMGVWLIASSTAHDRKFWLSLVGFLFVPFLIWSGFRFHDFISNLP